MQHTIDEYVKEHDSDAQGSQETAKSPLQQAAGWGKLLVIYLQI